MTNTCHTDMPQTFTLSRLGHPGRDAAQAQSRQWVARFREKTAHYLGLGLGLPGAMQAAPSPAHAPAPKAGATAQAGAL